MLAAFWPEPKLEGDSWQPVGKGDARGAQPAFWKPIDDLLRRWSARSCSASIALGRLRRRADPGGQLRADVRLRDLLERAGAASACCSATCSAGFNPWRATAKAVAWVAEKAAGQPMPAPLKYPERLGRWPAAIGLFAFAMLELVVDDGNLPRNVAIAHARSTRSLTWVGMALYGIDAWLDRGEAFSRLLQPVRRACRRSSAATACSASSGRSSGLAHLEPRPGHRRRSSP